MTDCIDRLRRLAGISRSSMEGALSVLRKVGLISVDGYGAANPEKPEWRKVVFYRLSGTPEHPLPGAVLCAREGHDHESGNWVPGDSSEGCLTCGFKYKTKPTARVVALDSPPAVPYRGSVPSHPLSHSSLTSVVEDLGQKGTSVVEDLGPTAGAQSTDARARDEQRRLLRPLRALARRFGFDPPPAPGSTIRQTSRFAAEGTD